MWHLDKPTTRQLDTYVDLLLPVIEKRIRLHRMKANERAWCDYLLPVNANGDNDTTLITAILRAEPRQLYKLNGQVLNALLQRCQAIPPPAGIHDYYYSERQLRTYLKAKVKRNPDAKERQRIGKYERLFVFLDKVFDYGVVKGEIAYSIAQMKAVNTCTYCNRQYTFTVGKEVGKGKKTSKVKPQFDHWFAHKQYPLLSLSFYNLIPSCSVCNSSVKGRVHYSLKTHVHPYMTRDCNPLFTFYPAIVLDKSSGGVRWSARLRRDKGTKEDNTIKALLLDDIYDQHGSLEVKDIMDFAIKNNATYLRTLFSKVCGDLKGHYTQSDVYRMLFGVDADINKTLDRPLSKLKRDVLELEGIKV